ncbi:MAG: uroporphyrinogen-III C-methyltransferase [Spirochaetia bacterium]|nr:uroporphyrinogen-III C-methyltransferase [Spirochaetia bacterium]
MSNCRKMGRVVLVGAGPGDPELLTLKAVRFLEAADAVVYDQLVGSEILHHCRSSAELIFAGKTKGNHTLPQHETNALLADLASRYALVVRLKGGDPLVFGRGGEEQEYLQSRGIECDVVPGITAASGAAASLGLPLTHRDSSSQILFLTGHKRSDGDYAHFRGLDLSRQTCVVYMGLTIISDIILNVSQDAANVDEPVCVVSNATRANQRFVTGTVGNILGRVHDAGIDSPALVIMGRVVNHLNKREALRTLSLASLQAEKACSP